MRSDRINEISNTLNKMSGKYAPYEVFSDWVRCMALAFANSCQPIQDSVWKAREEDYKQTMGKYTEEERSSFMEMMALLTLEYEENPRDVLGDIFMYGNMGNSAGGQFFTPYNISELMARISVRYTGETILLNEPSCGGGASIIAAAMKLKEAGVNYQKVMQVIAQDLDWRCVHMCYVQMSFLGINAICVQGDTLREPYVKGYDRRKMLWTPKAMGVLL